MIDLYDELHAAELGVTARHRTDLYRAIGLRHAELRAMRFGVVTALVRRDANGSWFEPCDRDERGASEVYVVPVCVARPGTERVTPIVHDLVAWQPHDPCAMMRRTGDGLVLGALPVLLAQMGDPLHLVPTALEWMRCRGKAACLLTFNHADAVTALAMCEELVVTDADLARRVDAALRPPPAKRGYTIRTASKEYVA